VDASTSDPTVVVDVPVLRLAAFHLLTVSKTPVPQSSQKTWLGSIATDSSYPLAKGKQVSGVGTGSEFTVFAVACKVTLYEPSIFCKDMVKFY
jgi:hypothetical protein